MILHSFQMPAELAALIEERFADDTNREFAADFDQFVANLFKQFEDPTLSLHHATTGVATEAGELLSVSKASWIYGRELDHKNIIEEAFDCYFYLQAILNFYQLNQDQVLTYGIQKLRDRYPNGYSDTDANLRADKAEGDSKI